MKASSRHLANAPRTFLRSPTRAGRASLLQQKSRLQHARLQSSDSSSTSPTTTTLESNTVSSSDDNATSTTAGETTAPPNLQGEDARAALRSALEPSSGMWPSSVETSNTDVSQPDASENIQAEERVEVVKAKKPWKPRSLGMSEMNPDSKGALRHIMDNIGTLQSVFGTPAAERSRPGVHQTPAEHIAAVFKEPFTDVAAAFSRASERSTTEAPDSRPPVVVSDPLDVSPSLLTSQCNFLLLRSKQERRKIRKRLVGAQMALKSGYAMPSEHMVLWNEYITALKNGDAILEGVEVVFKDGELPQYPQVSSTSKPKPKPKPLKTKAPFEDISDGLDPSKVSDLLDYARDIPDPQAKMHFLEARLKRMVGQKEKTKGKKEITKQRITSTKALLKAVSEDEVSITANGNDRQVATGWGEDELAPKSTETDLVTKPKAKKPLSVDEIVQERAKEEATRATLRRICGRITGSDRDPAPHSDAPLLYTRKIEGIVEPDQIDSILKSVDAPCEQNPVARLGHNLERVLFNPGVHWLQDPRSRVYNFDPYLQTIPPVEDFAFERIEGFIPSSQDPDLKHLLQKHDKRFSGSTSSLSGLLSHIYFLISGDKLVNTSMLGQDFNDSSKRFTPGQRMPTTSVFRLVDGPKGKKAEAKSGGAGAEASTTESGEVKNVGEAAEEGKKEETKTTRYCIDNGAGNSESDKNILTWLGHLLERFVTMPKEQFEGYLRSKPDAPLPEKSTKRDAFKFSTSNNFVMRSQLDCHHPRLPGSGVFDIKTRACVPIRLDMFNFEENSGYLIRTQQGRYESFEREYYDLIRSAFLKYQFQVRIGGMDGVIVAYHNTKRMFGFQYIPLEEMDDRLFGPGEGVGDRVFKTCVSILENIAEEVVGCFPNQDVRVMAETLEFSNRMKLWVEPVHWDDKLGARPIKELEVEASNYSSSKLATPWEAFCDTSQEWTVRWSISHVNADELDIRERFLGAKGRQLRAWTMPAGMDPDAVQEWYDSLDFGGTRKPGQEPGPTASIKEKFSPYVDRRIQYLRDMAKQGRVDTEKMEAEEAGKRVYVLGDLEDVD